MSNLLQIELTEQEASVLLQMLNEAVKARGLEAAQAGFFFQQKINKAIKEAAPDLEIVGEAQPIEK